MQGCKGGKWRQPTAALCSCLMLQKNSRHPAHTHAALTRSCCPCLRPAALHAVEQQPARLCCGRAGGQATLRHACRHSVADISTRSCCKDWQQVQSIKPDVVPRCGARPGRGGPQPILARAAAGRRLGATAALVNRRLKAHPCLLRCACLALRPCLGRCKSLAAAASELRSCSPGLPAGVVAPAAAPKTCASRAGTQPCVHSTPRPSQTAAPQPRKWRQQQWRLARPWPPPRRAWRRDPRPRRPPPSTWAHLPAAHGARPPVPCCGPPMWLRPSGPRRPQRRPPPPSWWPPARCRSRQAASGQGGCRLRARPAPAPGATGDAGAPCAPSC